MKVKALHIRLTKEHLESDQKTVNNFLESVTVLETESELVNGQTNFWSILVFYDENEKASKKISYNDVSELTNEEREYYESLRLWRQDKATHLGIQNFMICHNSELIAIAKEKPTKTEDLNKIKGFGKRKIARFGDDIIALLKSENKGELNLKK